jgi:hypothetical protein
MACIIRWKYCFFVDSYKPASVNIAPMSAATFQVIASDEMALVSKNWFWLVATKKPNIVDAAGYDAVPGMTQFEDKNFMSVNDFHV